MMIFSHEDGIRPVDPEREMACFLFGKGEIVAVKTEQLNFENPLYTGKH
jgi:hypothetical protein